MKTRQKRIDATDPGFCPRSGCTAHYDPPADRWWSRDGSYSTLLSGIVLRFRCRLCGKRFSTRSFSIDYYAKRSVSYPQLLGHLSSCCGVRAAGRQLQVDHKTIMNKFMRFARQALAAQALLLDQSILGEDLVIDGIQSFWISQYFPNNLQLIVGADSQFVYGYNGFTLRRSGRMTDVQKKRRETIEKRFRADSDATRRHFCDLLEICSRLINDGSERTFQLRTDEHRDYRRAVESHGPFENLVERGRVHHKRFSSKLPRTIHNPLFAVNYMEREIRKDLAEHVRESTRFARSVHGSMDRLSCYLFFHNFLKNWRAKLPAEHRISPARRSGISSRSLNEMLGWIFDRRVFFDRLPLIQPFLLIWFRMYQTPLRAGPAYLPGYFAV